jgi:hypothetical protein
MATTASRPRRIKPGPAVNEYGFVPGTINAAVAEILLSGGKDRVDVNRRVEAMLKQRNAIRTYTGNDKNAPALVAKVLQRMQENGFVIESKWRVVHRKPSSKSSAVSSLSA